MSTFYNVLKFLHLLGLTAFLLGHGVSAGVSLALRARPSVETSKLLLRLSVRAYVVAYPGLLLLIVTGVWMGFAGSWWGHGWIWAGIGVLVVVFVFMGALSAAYHKARAVDGDKVPDSEMAERLARTRPVALATIGSVALVVLVFLMVLKPF